MQQRKLESFEVEVKGREGLSGRWCYFVRMYVIDDEIVTTRSQEEEVVREQY